MVVLGGSHSEPNEWKMAGRFPKWLPLDKIWLIKNPLSPTHRVWRMEATFQSQLLDTTIYQTKNIEVSGWLYQIKTHFTHIFYQPFSRVLPPSFTLYAPIFEYYSLQSFYACVGVGTGAAHDFHDSKVSKYVMYVPCLENRWHSPPDLASPSLLHPQHILYFKPG